MRRLRVTLEYDGADFAGWQWQPEARSVQGVVEETLRRVTAEALRLVAAGRTDAGVHARGQVAHFDSGSRLSAAELARALNAELPEDVSILDLCEVPPQFHARRDAICKRYVYRILARSSPSPERRRVVWHLRQKLRIGPMVEAAKALEGPHDFTVFRGARGGPPPDEDTRRTLDRLELARRGDEIHLIAEARSFLRYMVRNLAGTLVEVGAGRLRAGAMADLLASRDRARAGPTAPPHGLCLAWVAYPERCDRPA